MTCKKAVFLEYNVVLSPLICSTFFGLDTAECWVSSPSLAKHGSVCYLLITVWHKIKCSTEGRPKCQHLTGWSPPAFMSQPWYTAWYMILLGNIYIYKYIKLSGVVVGLKLMRSSQKNKGLLTQDVSTCVSTKVFYLRVPSVFNSKKQLKKPPFQQKTTTLKDRTPLK